MTYHDHDSFKMEDRDPPNDPQKDSKTYHDKAFTQALELFYEGGVPRM